MPEDKRKIFISWSGDLAREVTLVLHGWLPEMFDGIKPWMSAEDIDAGARGLEEIGEQLDSTSFGIIVVTQANHNAPWLNFEAGALSKRFGPRDARTRVAPLLVDLSSAGQIVGPIKQFQANPLSGDGLLRVLKSISNIVGSDWHNIEKRFKRSWPELESLLNEARAKATSLPKVPKRPTEDMLEEILTSVHQLTSSSSSAWSGTISAETLDMRERAVDHMVRHLFGEHKIHLSSVTVITTLDGVIHIHIVTDENPQDERVRIAQEEVALLGPYQINVQQENEEERTKRARFEALQRKMTDPMRQGATPPALSYDQDRDAAT